MALHELRHFCATYLLELSLAPADVAVQLGYTDGGARGNTTSRGLPDAAPPDGACREHVHIERKVDTLAGRRDVNLTLRQVVTSCAPMNRTDDNKTWRVGDLARETGLTVRALHHYDRLELLPPSSRT
jgi:hypothetical protein